MAETRKVKLTGAQIRAGRAMLRISAQELADMAGIGVATVRRSEAVDGTIGVHYANSKAIQAALQSAGILFLGADGGGPGVRLRAQPD